MNEREFWIVILEWAVCWLLQSLWLLFIYLCMQEAQKIWDGNTWNSGRGDGSRILSWIPSPVCSHLLGSTAAEVCILLSVSVYKWECCWVCLCTSENAVECVCVQVRMLLSVSVYKWECCQWLCLSGESCLHCVYAGDCVWAVSRVYTVCTQVTVSERWVVSTLCVRRWHISQ